MPNLFGNEARHRTGEEMTEPKILTPKEALMALSAGRKLTKPDWPKKLYISLSDIGSIVNQDGCYAIFGGDYLLYTEPKPKRKVAPYIVRGEEEVWITSKFFENAADCLATMGPSVKTVRRVNELEVEIED